jgi:hypothetical protein
MIGAGNPESDGERTPFPRLRLNVRQSVDPTDPNTGQYRPALERHYNGLDMAIVPIHKSGEQLAGPDSWSGR